MTPPELNHYKQGIADLYNARSQTYDSSAWHLQICHRLLEHAQISSGQYVLDVATGTGHIAIAAAQIVGVEGRVVGIDIAAGMLDQAQNKVEALGLSNVEFQLVDAEVLDYPAKHFDRILCANAFPWMEEKAATLELWYQCLKPGGLIGIHTPAETAYVGDVVLRNVFKQYGISLVSSEPVGTVEKCHSLLANAGFEAIEVKTEQHGSYISLDKAKEMWTGRYRPTLGISKSPSDLSPAQLAQAKAEFEAELEALQTEAGIWNDLTTFYVLGRKPDDVLHDR